MSLMSVGPEGGIGQPPEAFIKPETATQFNNVQDLFRKAVSRMELERNERITALEKTQSEIVPDVVKVEELQQEIEGMNEAILLAQNQEVAIQTLLGKFDATTNRLRVTFEEATEILKDVRDTVLSIGAFTHFATRPAQKVAEETGSAIVMDGDLENIEHYLQMIEARIAL